MINILYCSDERGIQHCAVSLISLVENNIDSNLNVVIVGNKLTSDSKERLTEINSKYDNLTLNIIEFNWNKLSEYPQIGQYSKDIYLRLWVEEFFDESVDKVLYFDIDTLVVDDITPLWNTLMDNAVIAAVDIPFSDSHKRCHLPAEYNYFNSGVLLFNVQIWKEERCRQQLLEFLKLNKDIALNPDQDALNGCFYDRRITLDYRYNLISPFFRKQTLNEIKQLKNSEVERAVVIHFNGISKPWFYACNHPYQKRYDDYLRRSPWCEYIPPDKHFIVGVKKYLGILSGRESFVKLKNLKGH